MFIYSIHCFLINDILTNKKKVVTSRKCVEENKIKRELSYSDAIAESESPSKKKSHTLKSPEERSLRKNLALKLQSLEKRLLTGEFHYDTKNLKGLKMDCFDDAARPHIYEIIGDECDENPVMVLQAERLARRDIVKKRLYYLKKKMVTAVDMTTTTPDLI